MRRIISAVALTFAVLSVSPAFGNSWLLHRGSNARLGRTSETLPLPLSKVWQFHTNGAIESSPVVSDGTVFFGSMDGFLYAVDAVTGTLKWSYDGGGSAINQTRGIASSPCVSNGVVFVASRSGKLLAIDADTGNKVWEHLYGGQNRSSPIVSNGIVYCGGAYPEKLVVAVNATTGLRVWSATLPQYVNSSPAIDGSRLFIGCSDGSFRVFDALTGTPGWVFPSSYGTVSLSTPAVENGRVFCAPGTYGGAMREPRIFAVGEETGSQLWEFRVPLPQPGHWETSSYVSSPTAYSNHVFVVAGYPNSILYSLDATTGAKSWEYTLGTAPTQGFAASPTIAGDTLFIGSSSGILRALDAANGSLKWSYTMPSGTVSSAAVANGFIYVGCNDNSLYAFAQPNPITSPTGFVQQGWNLVSVPATPLNPDPVSVFSPIDIPNASLQFWKNDGADGYQLYGDAWGWEGPVVTGTPYWFNHQGSPVTLSFQAVQATNDQVISIPSHDPAPTWVMFGHPMNHRTSCSDVMFSTGSVPAPVDWPTAYNNGLVESAALGWDATANAYFSTGPASFSARKNVLEPWYGYWLLVRTPDVLNIHIPVAPITP